MSAEGFDDPAVQPAIDLIKAIAATEDEADTIRHQLANGEVAIIITNDGISVQPIAGKVIDIRDRDQ